MEKNHFLEEKMKETKTYVPAKAEIIHLDKTDVVSTSGFDTELPEGEWDKEL